MSKEIPEHKRKIVYKKYKGKCAYCGEDLEYRKMQVDHITPKYRKTSHKEAASWGLLKGTNDIENLNPSCRSCNASKSTFTIDNWRKELVLKEMRLMRDSSVYRILKRFEVIKVVKNEILFHFEIKKNNG
jgi:5-methylcytosine-specific restriction endonuclease McrA